MSTSSASVAARNNATWCDSVCCSTGGTTTTQSGLWWNVKPSPPYYPNLITVSPNVDLTQLMDLLHELSRDGAVIGIKDSFNTLDLTLSGFSVLFGASWIWRDPVRSQRNTSQRELRWAKIDSSSSLERWEQEWHPDRESGVLTQSIYGRSLLCSPEIGFVAAYAGSDLVGGAALTETEGTIGVTCTFFRGINPQNMRQELIAYIAETYPACPIIGYASGDELEAMKELGFKEIGPLRVWLGSAAR